MARVRKRDGIVTVEQLRKSLFQGYQYHRVWNSLAQVLNRLRLDFCICYARNVNSKSTMKGPPSAFVRQVSWLSCSLTLKFLIHSCIHTIYTPHTHIHTHTHTHTHSLTHLRMAYIHDCILIHVHMCQSLTTHTSHTTHSRHDLPP